MSGVADSGDSSSRRDDETGDDGSTSPFSAGSSSPPGPDEDELLSRAAAAATHDDDALGLAEQEVQDNTETPIITMARAYQLEMYEESMRRNIIAVVCAGPRARETSYTDNIVCRWTPEAGRHMCKPCRYIING